MALSKDLNRNTNIQIGDPCQIFYITLYSNKGTQKEDCEALQHVQHACSKKLLKVEGQTLDGTCQPNEVQDRFVEGMCMVLVAMHAGTSEYKVSTVQSHNIVLSGGTRFIYFHGFGNPLVTQLAVTFEEGYLFVRVRTNLSGQETIIWPDSPADDYMYRPMTCILKNICVHMR
jgi:hypothetical protein